MRYVRIPRSLQASVICLLAGGAAWCQSAEDLPEGKGKAEVARICGECHGLSTVMRAGHTADGWSSVVDEMVAQGAQGTDDDFELVVKYLAANFPPKVNVNKADAKELSTGLGISDTDAQAIVHYRETTGAIKDWSDLQKIPNIDMKKLQDQKNRIEFSTAQTGPGKKK